MILIYNDRKFAKRTFYYLLHKCDEEEEYIVSASQERGWKVEILVRRLWKVAFEQRTEQKFLSRIRRGSSVNGNRYRKIPVSTECKERSLNLGGNTDIYSP